MNKVQREALVLRMVELEAARRKKWQKVYNITHDKRLRYQRGKMTDGALAFELAKWYERQAGRKLIWRGKTGRVLVGIAKAEKRWKLAPRGDPHKGWLATAHLRLAKKVERELKEEARYRAKFERELARNGEKGEKVHIIDMVA